MRSFLNWFPAMFFAAALLFFAGCREEPPPVNTIKADAEGAVLFIDGEEYGTLPLTAAFPEAGRKMAVVRAPGYAPEWIWLTPPEEGKANEYSVKMRPSTVPVVIESLPAGAVVKIESSELLPAGAEVLNNGGGNDIVTPASLELHHGKYILSLHKKGCDPVNVPISVQTDAPQKITQKIESSLGLVNIVTIPDGADIFLNGEKIGVSDYSGYQLEGVYDLRIVKTGYGEYKTKINVIRGEEINIGPVDMKNLPGMLNITCSQDDAEVFVDGKSVGKTPLDSINLLPGSYEITVKKEGFVDYTGSCRIYSDKVAGMDVQLLSYYGSVEFKVEPVGTKVYFDGVFLGEAGDKPFKVSKVEYGVHHIGLHHEYSIPENTPAFFAIEVLQGQDVVLSQPVAAPVANVDIVMENNKPWRGKIELPADENAETLVFEPMEGGKITLRRDSIREIIPLKY